MKQFYTTPAFACIFTAEEDIIRTSNQLKAEDTMFGEGEDF